MSKHGSGTLHLSCPRWVKTVETKAFETEDCIYPNSISENAMMLFPEHIGETYEECSGDVECWYIYDEGQLYGPPENCYPAEEEFEVRKCDGCGADNWSPEECKKMEQTARDGGGK